MNRRAKRAKTADPTVLETIAAPRRSIALLAALGGLLLWLAFPPVGWTILAWVAPIPWLLLCQNPEPLVRRQYASIWVGSLLFWLVLLQGIRKAHPANYLGLCALAGYLAIYLPVFVVTVRCAVHYRKVPLWLAAPVVWTGLELVRGGLFTGFSAGLLGHTQAAHVWLIQIADVTGAYGVSFLLMLCAAALIDAQSRFRQARRGLPLAMAVSALTATIGYGFWRAHEAPTVAEKPLQVALLQGTRDKVFEFNPDKEQQSFAQYFELMKRARNANPELDLIVWPEGAFTAALPELIVRGPLEVPPQSGLSLSEIEKNIEQRQLAFAEKVRVASTEANRVLRTADHPSRSVHLILGVTSFELQGTETRNFNAALWVDPNGKISGRYYKMHLVMFGEYVPFSRVFPWLASWTPIGQGVTPGDGPESFVVNGYSCTPSICFESTVPHVIRRQVRQLAKETGRAPDVLINITDDGWFWGTNILDLHLACAVYRAVEMRRPFLVAANTGITANIDGTGRVLDRLPHRREGFILAEVKPDHRASFYARWGDLFAGGCALASLWWIIAGCVSMRKANKAAYGSPA